jgi:superfamily I DNA and/or RNA helicase
VAVNIICDLINQLHVTASEIVVITPYRANIAAVERALTARPECKGVATSTTDSYQGREGRIVFFILCVNSVTGAQFVADSHRLCVGPTRHTDALFVVGDINTKFGDKDGFVVQGENGADAKIKSTAWSSTMK